MISVVAINECLNDFQKSDRYTDFYLKEKTLHVRRDFDYNNMNKNLMFEMSMTFTMSCTSKSNVINVRICHIFTNRNVRK